jgi:hypothetical protein
VTVSTTLEVTGFQLCAPISLANGEDPIGTATPADAFLILEQRLPWPRQATTAPGFPTAVVEAVEREKGRGRRVRLLAVAPDRATARPGHSRVLHFRRPGGPATAFARDEYLAPDAEVDPLVDALLASPADLPRFAPYRQGDDAVRDLLVCTHGSRDACCATMGFPTYVALRRLAQLPGTATIRVWRSSHLGGHRFAPTLLDLPEGRLWGHLQDRDLETLVHRDAPPAQLRRRYRGWAMLDDAAQQTVEREILVEEGWSWTRVAASGQTLAHDPARHLSEVRITTAGSDGGRGVLYEATVDGSGRVETLGSSGSGPLQAEPQYRVTHLRRQSTGSPSPLSASPDSPDVVALVPGDDRAAARR